MDMQATDKFTDWVEQSALENIRAHIKSGDDFKREGYTALTVIMAGAGGLLAYTIKLFESDSHVSVAIAAGALSLYLFILSALLVINCLRVGAFPAPTNEPKNLNQRKFSLQQMREA